MNEGLEQEDYMKNFVNKWLLSCLKKRMKQVFFSFAFFSSILKLWMQRIFLVAGKNCNKINRAVKCLW